MEKNLQDAIDTIKATVNILENKSPSYELTYEDLTTLRDVLNTAAETVQTIRDIKFFK